MALKGCMGKITAGPTPASVGELRSWETDEAADVQDSSVMGNCAKRKSVVGVETTLNFTAYYAPGDAGQALLAPGDTVDVELYPEGETSALIYYTGEALITSRRRSADVNGMIEFTVASHIQGALTQQTVV
jgi:hypothetical protein